MGTWSLGEVLGMAVILAIIGVESDSWGYVHGHAVALLFPQATQMTCASIWKAEAPSLLSLWFHCVSLTSPRILLTTVSAPLASTSINSNSNVTQRSPSVKTLKLLCQAIETRVVKWLERLEAKHSLPSSMCIRSGMPFAKTSWSWCEPSWATAMAFGE